MSFAQDLRRAHAPLACFAAMGLLWGSFAADLPDLKAKLAVDEAELGLLLLVTPGAALLAMGLAGRLARALGALALPLSCLAMSLAFVLPGQVSDWRLFPLAMACCGAATGAVDILMNARVSALEAGGRPLMSLAHAIYSFGYALGAMATGALRTGGIGPAGVMGAMGGLACLVTLVTLERQGRITGLARGPAQGSGLGALPYLAGGIVLIGFLTENAAEYWSALHIEQSLGGSAAFGAAAPAILALTMGTARLFGHGLQARLAPGRLLVGGAVIAALGALGIAAAPAPGLAYLGFVVTGIGASVIAPTALTLAGQCVGPDLRARAVQVATMLGYCGYFVGPPGLGLIAGAFGLPMAFVAAALGLGLIPPLYWLLRRVAQRSP